MHPDLLNNSIFLRYYHQWQNDPQSIVFAPIAEYLLNFGMIEEALKVCRRGVITHPALISGRIVMAKICIKAGLADEAMENVSAALKLMPENETAKELFRTISCAETRVNTGIYSAANIPSDTGAPLNITPAWNTVTMAKIFASQGHINHARKIYNAILESDPFNEAARTGLNSLL